MTLALPVTLGKEPTIKVDLLVMEVGAVVVLVVVVVVGTLPVEEVEVMRTLVKPVSQVADHLLSPLMGQVFLAFAAAVKIPTRSSSSQRSRSHQSVLLLVSSHAVFHHDIVQSYGLVVISAFHHDETCAPCKQSCQ